MAKPSHRKSLRRSSPQGPRVDRMQRWHQAHLSAPGYTHSLNLTDAIPGEMGLTMCFVQGAQEKQDRTETLVEIALCSHHKNNETTDTVQDLPPTKTSQDHDEERMLLLAPASCALPSFATPQGRSLSMPNLVFLQQESVRQYRLVLESLFRI